MSIAYYQIEDGTLVLINNVFIDEAGVEQTLDNNFVDEAGVDQQIFYLTEIPMWPAVGLTGHPRVFEALDLRVFEAIDVRVFEL